VKAHRAAEETDMGDLSNLRSDLPSEQQGIWAKCVHPTGTFVEFTEAEVEQSIPDRFQQQVAKHTDRLAVKMQQGALTYRELNRAANRVARVILAKVGPGQEPVGLLFENGAQAISAILGVLRAGKFYVPLDPSFPHGRLAAILENSGTQLLVTDRQNFRLASELAHGTLHLLDIDTMAVDVSDENLSLPVPPDALASIFYTSGSTAQPKGVVHTHRCLLHGTMIHTNNLHITPDDRLSLLHSWSVHSCAAHLFGSLLNGAALFPFDPRRGGGKSLARWLMQERVTMYHSVPMVFRQMAAGLTGKEVFPHLRTIVLSGAPMSRTDVDLYKRHFPAACVLLHMLGTTETGWIRRFFIHKATQIAGGTVPIGYAVQDTEVILLNDGGTEAGCRQVGEIALRGRYLASGYWRNHELTQAKFVPCTDGGEQRIYRTGDLARMGPDGCLFHLGRKDFQVKVRGYRVELGEVERALLEHPAVKEVAAVGRKVRADDTQLLAYFVPSGEHVPTVTEMRRFLQVKLPDYMVPSIFVMLRALPCTPNGKLDYRALPAPEPLRPALEATYLAPKSEIEQLIATVWQEVLGFEQVGVQDNFFDLGGDSLLLTQVHRKLQDIMQQDIPIVDLFEHPTINALVAYVSRQERASTSLRPSEELVESLRVGKDRRQQLSQRRQRGRRNGNGRDTEHDTIE
jgi:amino acid adenylation domain-containing protein